MLINYQGELRSPTTGEPVPDGDYDMLFKIYPVASGGAPIWIGACLVADGTGVSVRNGRFSVILGSGAGNTLRASIFNQPDRWLEILIKGQAGLETLTPRQRITSVPYAILCATVPESTTGTSDDPIMSIKNFGAGYALACYADSSYAIRGDSDGETGRGVHGEAGGQSGYGVSGYAGGENGRGVVGMALRTGPVTNYGGYFEAAGAMARGVYGLASATGSAKNCGGYFEAKGDSGIGVVGKGTEAGVLCQGDLVVANGGESRFTGDVQCQKDLVVTGAYRGSIGPNGGAPFPRPPYDSGWQAVPPGTSITLTHNIGGNPDDYVVDIQFHDDDEYGRLQGGGMDRSGQQFFGATWTNLTASSLEVRRGPDSTTADKVRVRIWVCN